MLFSLIINGFEEIGAGRRSSLSEVVNASQRVRFGDVTVGCIATGISLGLTSTVTNRPSVFL